MKKFVQGMLAKYAAAVIRKAKPTVIGITGSVGKSSTKEAIAAVLRGRFAVRASPGNYNTEFGLPLAVLGLETPRTSLGWLGTLWRARAASAGGPDFPTTLVLEMAADRPGDIVRLCGIAPPDIGVVTAVGESHLESFGSVEVIAKEKRSLVEHLGKDGLAVLNRDDETVWAMRAKTKAKIKSYGFHEDADVRAAGEIAYAFAEGGECGMHFKVSAAGSIVPMFLPGVFGRQAISAALAAAAIGLEKGMNLVEISDALGQFRGAPGRMRYVAGIKRTVLIDDTYNSAPRSALAALYALREIPLAENNRRYAILGDMLELGALSEQGHAQVGREAAECADVLIFVGERMGAAEKAARDAGAAEDHVFHFATTEETGRFAQERVKQGDVILVKGSRGMQMEAVVKELMASPLSAASVLVGEHDEWRP